MGSRNVRGLGYESNISDANTENKSVRVVHMPKVLIFLSLFYVLRCVGRERATLVKREMNWKT